MYLRLLFVDNRDSFTYNIVQAFQQLECDVRVVSNTTILPTDVDGVIIGPGPGTPRDAGNILSIIRDHHRILPILGICLGMQAIGEVFGGNIVRAKKAIHGKTIPIHHDEKGLFDKLPRPFLATRYNSLVIENGSFCSDLAVTAWSPEGEIMGVAHRWYPVSGVQFHPESAASEHGLALFQNFLYSIQRFQKEKIQC